MKTCCRCKEPKEVSDFYKNKSTKDGFSHECKKCIKSCQDKYREKNREILNERAKKRSKNLNESQVSALREKVRARNAKTGYTKKQWEKIKSTASLLQKKREADASYRRRKIEAAGPKHGPRKPRSDKDSPDVFLEKKKNASARLNRNLARSIVVGRLIQRSGIDRGLVSDELIDAYRSLLLIKRSLKNEKRDCT